MALFPADDPRIREGRRALKKTQHGGYAHFPGTGPAGRTCGQCEHAVRGTIVHGRAGAWGCEKWRELMSPNEKQRLKAPEIISTTAACKYFKERRRSC